MIRTLAIAFGLACIASAGLAQTPTAPSATAATATSAVKPPAKRPAPKPAADAKPHGQAASGPCLGIIAAAGDRFMVKKIGFTVFGNDEAEVPIEAWGLDDLIVDRFRAAAGSKIPVVRLAYPKAAFEPYYHPQSRILGNPRDDLTAIVRQIAATAHCERYVAVTRLTGEFPGTNQTLSGVGVVQGSLYKTVYLFAFIQLTVFDGQSFAIRKNPHANFESVVTAAFTPKKFYERELDNGSFPSSAAEAANSATLRNAARGALTEKLDRMLPDYLKE
jgi:hypothetical protein